MKATELRLMNLIYNKQGNTVYVNTNHLTILLYGIENEFKPIPLTEEWLLKFGFEFDEEDDGYQKGKYKVSVSDEGCLFFINIGYYPEEIAEFNYVHQLQNLYFALTNEELILNS